MQDIRQPQCKRMAHATEASLIYIWSTVVAIYYWCPCASPIHWCLEFPVGWRWPDSSRNSPVAVLASHAGTVQLGQVVYFPMICFQWWRDDALLHCHDLHHTPWCTWVRQRIISATYALRWDRTGQVCMWEPVVCRWAPACYSRLPRRSSYHIQKTVKLCHILLDYGRGAVPRTLMDRYWSGWYVLECHDNVFLYQSPPKALIGQETQNTWQPTPRHHCPLCGHMFCMAIFCGMCQMQKNPSICLWMVAWLKRCDITWSVSNLVLRRSFPPK